jgi:hypothetical protein
VKQQRRTWTQRVSITTTILVLALLSLIPAVRQKGQEAEVAANGLRQEIDTLRSGKIDAERKLNEMEQAVRVCESQHTAVGGSSQQQLGQKVRELIFTDSIFENSHNYDVIE